MSTAALHVISAGPLSSVQDRGRRGWRALGVGVGGAVDGYSALLGNRLVGNPDHAAVLELTLAGPRLRVLQPLRIALTGADINARCGDQSIPGWRPVSVPAGAELRLGRCLRGARAYLAIAGGIAATPVLDSRATDLRGGFGGIGGRALRAGDALCLDAAGAFAPVEKNAALQVARWWIDPVPDLDLALPAVAALLPGAASLTPAARAALYGEPFVVAPASNRIGLRLAGPQLQLAAPWQHPSEPVVPGTVQLPPDGQPIVLLGDCGTVGGYPRVGHVAGVDLPRLAQLRPGETLRFAPATLEDADRRACEREVRLSRIGLAIEQRLPSA